MMRASLSIPSDRDAIRGALEGLVRINQDLLRSNPDIPPIYKSGVRYRAEAGTEDWRNIADIRDNVEGDGPPHGDCEDLAAWRAAELREREGENASVDVVRGGRGVWHAVVRRADGRIEDPSKQLGMDAPLAGRRTERMAGALNWRIERLPGNGGWRGTLEIPDIRFGRGADGMIRVSVSGATRAEAMQRAAALAGIATSHRMLRGLCGAAPAKIRTVARIAGLARRDAAVVGRAARKLSPGMARVAEAVCR